MRKPLMAVLIAGCLVLTVVGGLLPFLQGWIFFILALYLFATEFDTGRHAVKWARGRWPFINRWIERTCEHRWAPKRLHEFDQLTDPKK